MTIPQSWTNLPSKQYAYESHTTTIPPIPDPYNRNITSLLTSIGELAENITVGKIAPRPPHTDSFTLDDVVYPLEDFSRVLRICRNSMEPPDYEHFFDHFITERSRKGSAAFHIDFNKHEAMTILDSLPDLTLFNDIIFTTFSPNGKLVIFLVLPSDFIAEAYLTSRVPFNEVEDHTKKLSWMLQKSYGKMFSIKRRLQVAENFHQDSLFTGLFLVYQIQCHGKYLLETETSINHFKLWILSKYIQLHDYILGQLRLQDITDSSHPFYKTDVTNGYHLDLITRKGWYPMDVEGDGNCGYYSLLFGLENVGITDFQIDTRQVPPSRATQRWRIQVLELRKRLLEGSRTLLSEVYPIGSAGRQLSWWLEEIGASDETEKNQLSNSFWIHNNKNLNIYFQRSVFVVNEEYHEYHMNPYWSALVIAYVFNVRVVVITRTSSPADEEAKRKNKPAAYSYGTKIFNFDDNFQQNKHTFNPIESHACCYRLGDARYNSKRTIELLFLTGYTGVGKEFKDNQHFLFLRRIYSVKVPATLSAGNIELRDSIGSENAVAEQDTLAAPLGDSPGVREDDPPNNVPVSPTLKKATPMRGKQAAKIGKKSVEKRVIKTRRQSKVAKTAKDSVPLQVSDHHAKVTKTSTTPKDSVAKPVAEDEEPEPNDEHIRYDTKTGHFYSGTFNNTTKRYTNRHQIEDISDWDSNMIDDARKKPNTWIAPPIGDAFDHPPPKHLVTKVKTLFEQLERNYCLSFSFASALYYCGFEKEGVELSKNAVDFSEQNMNAALETFRGFMPNLVPPIGLATVYGLRVAGHNRKKRDISWDDLFTNITPYPTMVIPVTKRGRMTHAFCVVDDLIFDSCTTHALKLTQESVDWIFNDEKMEIFMALRFNQKISPAGHKLKRTYTREVTYHWDRVSEEVTKKQKRKLRNKSYDVEAVPGLDPTDVRLINMFTTMEIDP